MYAIQKHIEDKFAPFAKPSFGAIKPALRRLEEKECLTARKMMSDGGKLSIFYSITKQAEKEIKNLLLEDLSDNPIQFMSLARMRLACADVLNPDERKRLFFIIKTRAMQFKNLAEYVLKDEYTHINFYQKIVIDNASADLKNFITIVEGLEKDNARNS